MPGENDESTSNEGSGDPLDELMDTSSDQAPEPTDLLTRDFKDFQTQEERSSD